MAFGYTKLYFDLPNFVEKNLVKGYDSNWEYVLHQGILSDWDHHNEKPVDYIVEHKYHPDFVRIIDGKKIGPGNRTYFIADIAANHDGDF